MNIGIRLSRLNNEDFIWIIYFFIAIAAIYSNSLDRKYYLNNDYTAWQKEKAINVAIFTVAFFIYLYFVIISIEDLNNVEKNFQNPSYCNRLATLIAALLFLIGGIIYLIVEFNSTEPEEIGFN